MMKYPSVARIATIPSKQKTSIECYAATFKGSTTCATVANEVRPSNEPTRRMLAKELELVPLLSPEKQVNISTNSCLL